jgi:hypothetical protein
MGFRAGRSQHDALDALYAGLLTKDVAALRGAPRELLRERLRGPNEERIGVK